MTVHEFDIAYLDSIRHLQPPGWSDITAFFEFYARRDFCRPIMVLDGTDVIGVGNATSNGATGWLAHIIVDRDYRGMGIGSLLTGHLIDHLHSGGCKTILLIATGAGKRLYERFGFETVDEYLRFDDVTVLRDARNGNVRRYRKDDFETLMALDREVSGEDRSSMLAHFLEEARVYAPGSAVEGFFLTALDEGMIVAANDEAGLALLEIKHNRRKGKTVIPAENRTAARYLSSMGCGTVSRIPRMMLGEGFPWKPELIFSRAGGFYG